MAKINGFTVIADKATSSGDHHILGHRDLGDGHEYVVGRYVRTDQKSWGSGYYTRDLQDALDALKEL